MRTYLKMHSEMILQDVEEGELIAKIEGTRVADKAYSSVQFGHDKHFEVHKTGHLNVH